MGGLHGKSSVDSGTIGVCIPWGCRGRRRSAGRIPHGQPSRRNFGPRRWCAPPRPRVVPDGSVPRRLSSLFPCSTSETNASDSSQVEQAISEFSESEGLSFQGVAVGAGGRCIGEDASVRSPNRRCVLGFHFVRAITLAGPEDRACLHRPCVSRVVCETPSGNRYGNSTRKRGVGWLKNRGSWRTVQKRCRTAYSIQGRGGANCHRACVPLHNSSGSSPKGPRPLRVET